MSHHRAFRAVLKLALRGLVRYFSNIILKYVLARAFFRRTFCQPLNCPVDPKIRRKFVRVRDVLDRHCMYESSCDRHMNDEIYKTF